MVYKINNSEVADDIKGYKIDISERNEMSYYQGLINIKLFIETGYDDNDKYYLAVDLTDLPKEGYSTSEIEIIKSNISEGLNCLGVRHQFDE